MSEKNLKNWVKKHEVRYNRTAKTGLDFKSPDQVVAEYFSKYSKIRSGQPDAQLVIGIDVQHVALFSVVGRGSCR